MLKGNNLGKLLILLVVLVGIYFIVKWTGDSGRSKSFRSTLVELDTAKVTRLEVYAPGDTAILKKTGEGWTVDGEKKGDVNSIKSLMNNLMDVKPSRLASRSEDSWKDFQVDDQGTRVVAYEDGDKVLDIILGRFGVEGQRSFYSYVRLSEESDVYVAKDFMKMNVSASGADYRNDDFLRFEKDSLSKIVFDYPDSAFTLTKTNGQWSTGDGLADSASVAKYIQSVRYSTSKNFDEQPSSAAEVKVTYETKDKDDITMSGYGGGVLGSSYNPDEYWKDQTLYDKIFKGRSHFRADE